MATLKIIDGRDKFVFEVDGHKIPNVIDYEIIRGNNSPAYLKNKDLAKKIKNRLISTATVQH